jgi:hypothetical protein
VARAHRHRITISGRLGVAGREEFGDYRIEDSGSNGGSNTMRTGGLDQPVPYGAANRILALGWGCSSRRAGGSRRAPGPSRESVPA